MQIIIPRQTLTFHQDTDGASSGITVTPASAIQVVPDWVRDSLTFQMAVKGGQVIEINPPAPPPEGGGEGEGEDPAHISNRLPIRGDGEIGLPGLPGGIIGGIKPPEPPAVQAAESDPPPTKKSKKD